MKTNITAVICYKTWISADAADIIPEEKPPPTFITTWCGLSLFCCGDK
jgi:hypothetical protein